MYSSVQAVTLLLPTHSRAQGRSLTRPDARWEGLKTPLASRVLGSSLMRPGARHACADSETLLASRAPG
jgi:hypothetical protein